jgi:hypothetical protein
MNNKSISLTNSEIVHLLHLIEVNQRDGSYYGNFEQYNERTNRLINKLKNGE